MGAPRPIEYFYGQQLGNIAQVNIWMAMAIGVGAAFAFLMLIWMVFPGTYLYELFLERSWVQWATTGLGGWTAGILLLKVLHIKKQRRALMLESLPEDISPEINMHTIADFYDHVINLPRPLHSSFIFKRIRKGLEYFYVRENNAEVATMMSTQSDIDANSIASSYAMTKVFLWAIPIVGFIGTVLGIGSAIGEFADTLAGGSGEEVVMEQSADGSEKPAETSDTAEEVSEEDAMMAGLQKVLGGLGTAFDTTFLALIFSILLMIPASSIQATEEDLLNLVDEYCNDNLVKRLNDGGGGSQFTDAAALKTLGEAISASNKDVVAKFADIHGNMKTVYTQQTEHYQKVAEAVEKQLGSIDERAEKYESKLDQDISKSIDTLAQGITNLNSVLRDLDGKQIVVKKKFWPFG